jgi:hypothetical protein
MRLLSFLAFIVVYAAAQGIPQFDTIPSNITAGLSYAISWQGGDGTVSWRQSTNVYCVTRLTSYYSQYHYLWLKEIKIFL